MLNKLLYMTVAVICSLSFADASLAPFVTKCRSDDAECHVANTRVIIPLFAAGIPELGVETLDPAYFDYVNCSKLNLKFIVSDVYVKGWKDCKPIDIHRDAPKSKIYIKLSCAVDSYGQYELTGKVLALDIRGRGNIRVLLRRCEVSVVMDIDQTIGNDGKKHFNVTKFKYTFELIEKSDVVFENLFQGNEALSTAAAEVIKNSGNEIVREIGDPMFHAAVTKVVKNMNNFFNAVPIEDLSID